jgi:shikimate dehydrogenase
MGMRSVAVQARNLAEAATLANQFSLTLPPQPFDAPIRTDGLINATPLGMNGAEPLQVELSLMPKHGWVFDLVSSPARTPLVAEAEARELSASGGLTMLIEQAAASFPLMLGVEPPRSPEGDAELHRRLSA